MSIEKTITLYQYDELSEKAKEKARDWWLSCRDESDYESVIDDFHRIADFLGIDFKTHSVQLMSGKTREDANIWWSVGYCQSDFAAFDGRYSYRKGGAVELKAYAPQDMELQRIAAELQALQAKNFYKLRATITHSDYYGMQVETWHSDDEYRELPEGTGEAMREAMRDLAAWLYKALREQDEYLASDEQISDTMEANEYTFRADGTRED